MRGTSNDKDDFLSSLGSVILALSSFIGVRGFGDSFAKQYNMVQASAFKTYATFRRLCQPFESMSVMIIHTTSVAKSSLRANRS